ncbi:MAG TPA: glycosyltransferase family 2 protein [Nitrolancea sp.]
MEDTKAVDLSVIIVSWNTRELLARCLKSLYADADASSIALQAVVVDNASSDGTIKMLAERFPAVHVVARSENSGFASATNAGIRQALADEILLLNPDTELLPGALAALRSALHAMPHVGLASGILLNPDHSLQSAGYRFPTLTQSFLDFFPVHNRLVASSLNGRFQPGDGLSPYAVDHPLGACMLVRSTVIEQVGLLDENYFMYSEEIDWCRRIGAGGWTILIAPSAHVIHYGGQSTSQVSDAMFRQLHRSRARYFAEYHSRAYLQTVERMASAASWWVSRRDKAQGRQLREVSGIYRTARGDYD